MIFKAHFGGYLNLARIRFICHFITVRYKNVALPLMFRMLNKRGDSNTAERIALLRGFITWFDRDHGLDYLSRVLLTGRNELNINLLKFLSCT